MFKLRQYFSIASAIAIVLVTAATVLLYHQSAVNDLVESAEHQNEILAGALANGIWPRFSAYITSESGKDPIATQARPETRLIRKALATLTAGLPVIKVNVYNQHGITIYSSIEQDIGQDHGSHVDIAVALRSGRPITELRRAGEYGDPDSVQGGDFVESYVPILGKDGVPEGIFEIYSDVTPLLARIDHTTNSLGLGLFVTFALLYAVLFWIVEHADGILKRQYADLEQGKEAFRNKHSELEREIAEHKKTEVELRLARDELEYRVAARTTELAKANEELTEKISERGEVEKTLQDAIGEAKRANKAKSNFVAAASHDLRQPVQTLVLYMALLSKKITSKEENNIISIMQQTLSSITALLKSLLDISKLEAGAVVPELEDFQVQELLLRVVNDFTPLAEEKGLELRLAPSSRVVRSCPNMLESIVRNLISNAVTHTARGRVLIGCRRRGAKLRVEVWDSGPGIPAEQIGTVFGEFVQLRGSTGDHGKGIGLGLAIVERSARLLDHRIDVKSVLGRGSMFAVEVPFGTLVSSQVQAVEAAPKEVDIAGSLVILIEDEPIVLDALRRMLEDWGCDVVASESGNGALNRLSPSLRRPDLIIADYRLRKGMTGVDAIARIRDSLGVSIPALIITGDTVPERLQQTRMGGIRLLHKPIAPEQIRPVIQDLLGGAPPVH